MTKKSASKKQHEPSPEAPIVEQEKPSSKPRKMGSEIDEIFAGKKRKRPVNEKIGSNKATTNSGEDENRHKEVKTKKKKKGRTAKDNPFAEPPSRPRKRTADGLTIYTEEELRIGKADAGGTRLCPFDCDCCF